MADLMDWKRKSLMLQDQFSSLLNNRCYDRFLLIEEDEMERKVMDVFFRLRPGANVNTTNIRNLYEESDLKKGEQIIALIKKYSPFFTHYDIATIYVCVFSEGRQSLMPVIRVRKSEVENEALIKNDFFIDQFGRVYDSWEHYLDTNTLEMSTLCIPVDGYYSKKYNFKFVDQTWRGYITGLTNQCSLHSMTATGVGLVMSFFPPTAPLGIGLVTASSVAAVPSGVMSTALGLANVKDRYSHDQSINPLMDPEAWSHWLNVGLSLSSIATLGASKYLAHVASTGRTASTAARVLVNACSIGTFSYGGLVICQQIYNGYSNWSEMTRQDIFQLSCALVVFSHSFVNLRLANQIIDDAQNNRLDQFRDPLGRRNQGKIDELVKESIAQHGSEKGKQLYIQKLNSINNVEAYLCQWRLVAGRLEAPGSKHLPSTRIITPAQRVQRATTAAIQIGQLPVERFSPSEANRFNDILLELEDSSYQIFVSLLSNTNIRSFFHMTILLDKFLEHLNDKILEMRVVCPDPMPIPGHETVPEYYRRLAEMNIARAIERRELTAESLLTDQEYIIKRFVPELHTFPKEKYVEIAEQLVDFESEMEWIEHENFLICRCKQIQRNEPGRTPREEIQEVKFSNMSPQIVNAINLTTKRFRRLI